MENNKYEHLFDLERELLDPATRTNRERLEILLGDSFFEFGSSGKVWNRTAVIDRLPSEKTEFFNATAFRAHEMKDDLVLVTYRTERKIDQKEFSKALRSSIWSKSKDGWQMIFHQGTLTAD